MKYFNGLLLLVLVSCTTQVVQEPASRTYGTIANQAMVSSAHPEASRVGVEILQKGGNAYDAAIAVQFALAVVYPSAGNIGGGGFLVYRKADGAIGSLDFREKAPLNAHKDMYLDDSLNVIDNLSRKGHLAVGVPGAVDGMLEIHKKLGKLPFGELVQPAIDLAAKGVVLTEKEAGKLNGSQEVFHEVNARAISLTQKSEWNMGDTLFQPQLAETLTRIRDNGRSGFYEGETADFLVAEMQKGQGLITHEDLAAYQSVWREPITGSYRNHKIITMGPPSSGGIALMQLLKGTEPHDISSWGFNKAATVHLMVELERRVYADRATHLGDPDFYEVPQQMLMDSDYLEERYSDINFDAKTPSQEVKEGEVQVIESIETTHFSVVDASGNAAAITTTLNGGYGSKVMVEGAGFLLNNEMDDFSVKPGVPNMFGLVGAEANAIAPQKRMLSSMTPTIVEKEGKLYMVVGTPGGSTIITSVYQTILNVIDHNMSMQEAVNAGKFHSQWLPDMVLYEDIALDSLTLKDLEQKGHVMQSRNGIGRMDCILVEEGQLEGGADPRGDNTALGY